MRLKNKTVLVTGASKGIGAALAIGCAKEGSDVILNYNTDRDGAEQTASVDPWVDHRSDTPYSDSRF